MKALLLTALLTLIGAASAQATLNPLNGINVAGVPLKAYPDYLGATCGGVQYSEEDVRYGVDADGNPDGTALAEFRFTTRCSTGGRGTKPRTYLECWDVGFNAAGFVTSRERVLVFSWLQGQPGLACPGLPQPDEP